MLEKIKELLEKHQYSMSVILIDENEVALNYCGDTIGYYKMDRENGVLTITSSDSEDSLNVPSYALPTLVYFHIVRCCKVSNFSEQLLDFSSGYDKIDKSAFLSAIKYNESFHRLVESSQNSKHPYHFTKAFEAAELDFYEGYVILEKLFYLERLE